MELQDESILIELECLVCKEYLYSPIGLCRTGHSICEKCRRRLTHCPICDASIGNSRNFTLESIIAKFKLPCKYKDAGCTVLETGDKIKMHEEFCEFGEISCPLKDSFDCPWTGKLKDLVIHAQSDTIHPSRIVNNREHCLKKFFYIVGNRKWFSLVNAYGKTFKYCFNVNFSKMVVRWNLQFVGPQEDASNFSYIITLIDKNNSQKKFTIMSTCEPLGGDDQAFAFATYVNYNKLRQFYRSNESLYFHFKIVVTKDLDTLIPTLMRNPEDANVSKRKRLKISNNLCTDADVKDCIHITLFNPPVENSSEADSH